MATESEILAELEKFRQPMNMAEASRFLKMLAWGQEGVGKTTLFGKLVTALDTGSGKIIIVYTDPGWDVLLSDLPVSIKQRVELVEFQGLSHVAAIVGCIENKIAGYEDVTFFALDTLSGMVEYFLDNVVENSTYEHRNEIILQKPLEGYKKGAHLQVPHWNDYHLLRNKTRPIIKKLIKLPMHVFVTAHVNEDDKGKLSPSMPESVLKVVAREVGLVGYLKRDVKGNRSVSLSTLDTVRAKSRIKRLDGQTMPIDTFVSEVKNWSLF